MNAPARRRHRADRAAGRARVLTCTPGTRARRWTANGVHLADLMPSTWTEILTRAGLTDAISAKRVGAAVPYTAVMANGAGEPFCTSGASHRVRAVLDLANPLPANAYLGSTREVGRGPARRVFEAELARTRPRGVRRRACFAVGTRASAAHALAAAAIGVCCAHAIEGLAFEALAHTATGIWHVMVVPVP